MSLEDRFYPALRFYEALPIWVQHALGLTYRRLPRRWRFGSRYGEFRELAEQVRLWSPVDIEDYQLRQLQVTLAHAGRYCPYYRRRFAEARFDPASVRSAEDMAGCPMLERRDLLEHRHELASSAVPESERLYITSGGSTGVPVGFYLQKGVSRPKEQAFLEAMWRRAGYFDGARLAVIRGHVVSSRAAGRIARHDATRDWLILSSYHLTEERLPEYLDALERFKPDLLHAYPSAALQLAEHLERGSRSWRLPLRALLCGSERLTLTQKRLLERVFGCRVYRWYGHSERVVLAGEGESSDLFYFWPTYGFVEFGPPDPEGLREVIGTSFHNVAMPLVRYRTGDYVRLAEGTEFPWVAASEIAGREQEFLLSGTGRRISLTAFNMHDEIFDDLYAVQFFQERPGAVEFRFLPGAGFDRSRLRRIEEGILRKLGDDFEVTLQEVRETEKTERGKHRWLVSRLSEAGVDAGATEPRGERSGATP